MGHGVLWSLLVGGPGHRVFEERRETIDAQLAALSAGTISAVMLPAGSLYAPPTPLGMARLTVDKKLPGAGVWIYNPCVITAEAIRTAAAEGEHGKILGHLQSKAEQRGKLVDVVQAVNVDGVVIQDSAVERGNEPLLQWQIEVMRARHPKAEIKVVEEDDVTAPRIMDRQQKCRNAWQVNHAR